MVSCEQERKRSSQPIEATKRCVVEVFLNYTSVKIIYNLEELVIDQNYIDKIWIKFNLLLL